MTEDGGGRKGGGGGAPRYRGFGRKGGVWDLPMGAVVRGRGGVGNELWENVGFCEIRWVGQNGLSVWGGVV
jgi:hypothetical protein